MSVHKPQNVWLSALGLLTALLWTAQFSVDWLVPHSDIRIAELGKLELASAIKTERTDSTREQRLERKSDPVASDAGPFAVDATRTERNHSTFAAENARRKLALTLPGIRAPPHYFLFA